MKQALVTGGGGFLARYVVERLLQRGVAVRSLARGDYPELTELGVECVCGDLRKPDDVTAACKGCDVVFHVAAIAGMWGDYQLFHDVNVMGTDHVIAACRDQGVRKLVYTSSPSVVFSMGDLKGVDESHPYPDKFHSPYAKSKSIAERNVLAANDESLATCALRPHLIWGPRDTHILKLLIDRATAGKLAMIGAGDNVVDLTYVENAADAHLQAADALDVGSSVAGNAYFISDGAPVNLWIWIEDFLERMDLPPIRKSVSATLAMRLAFLLEGIHKCLPFLGEPRLTRFTVSNFSTSHYFDIGAARRDFDYAPNIDNEEGLKRTIAWFKENGSKSTPNDKGSQIK